MLWPWPLTFFKVKFLVARGTTILRICLCMYTYEFERPRILFRWKIGKNNSSCHNNIFITKNGIYIFMTKNGIWRHLGFGQSGKNLTLVITWKWRKMETLYLCPPLKKEGHIALHMSVGVSVSLNLCNW